jgi:hypothetical protein
VGRHPALEVHADLAGGLALGGHDGLRDGVEVVVGEQAARPAWMPSA